MVEQRITVAHIHWGFPPTIGGVETHLSILLPELVKRGHAQWVFTSDGQGLEARANFQGAEVIRDKAMCLDQFAGSKPGLDQPEVLAAFRKFLDLAKPAVIHAHNLHYFTRLHAKILADEAAARGLPLMLTAHNVWSEPIFLDLTVGFPWDHIIAVSHFIKKEISGVGFDENKITVVHHGIDTEKFKPVKDPEKLYKQYPRLKGKRVIFHPARISLGKGGDVSIKAAHIVRKHIKDIILVLAGTENIIDWNNHREGDLEYMSQMIRTLELQDNIYLDAFSIDQMAELYNLAEVCVYPSTAFEPFGLTMLEAQASEKPIVVTRTGGMPEIIHDGINGYVVNIRDHETLAQRVIMLMQDQALCRRLGEVGRKNVVRHFNKNNMAEETLDVYREVLAGR